LEIHDKLKDVISTSGMTYQELSREIGQGDRYISNLLKSQSDPGFSTVAKICAVLGVTPNQLTGVDDSLTLQTSPATEKMVQRQADKLLLQVSNLARQRLAAGGISPTIDDLLEWWHREDGVLWDFERFSEQIDLYAPPEATSRAIEPVRAGRDSLASRSFGTEDTESLRRFIRALPDDMNEKLVLDQVETHRQGPKISIEELVIKLPDVNTPAIFKYKRLYLPVRDLNGSEMILNYSQAIR
jgi:transcriptional regulator with XRE-family HTH domain